MRKRFLVTEDHYEKSLELEKGRRDNVEKSGIPSDKVVIFKKGLEAHVVSQTPAFIYEPGATFACNPDDICEIAYPFGVLYVAVCGRIEGEGFIGQFLKALDPYIDSKVGHNFVAVSRPLKMGFGAGYEVNLAMLDREFSLNLIHQLVMGDKVDQK